ncbi:MAG: Preprotein translocase SecE [Thermoanaerobacterales bacterium 50_218]|nr:MAG: Preprotein translocase SecE [Thermoanaerobacterales bacterium 50_218]HAA90675.1 preprotein translocase subunit SecE [Peptococcaceae bacterium]
MAKKTSVAKARKNEKARPGKAKPPEVEETQEKVEEQKKSVGAFLKLVKPRRDSALKEAKKRQPPTVRPEKRRRKEPFYREGYRFLQNVWSELKKVYWPKRSEIAVYTAVVIGSVSFLAIIFWIVDSILSQLLELVL